MECKMELPQQEYANIQDHIVNLKFLRLVSTNAERFSHVVRVDWTIQAHFTQYWNDSGDIV